MIPRWDTDANRVVIGIIPELDTDHPVVAKTIATEQHPNAAAIPRGATITAIDGVEVKNFYDIARQLKRNSGQRVTIDWRLDAQKAGNAVIDVGEKRDVVRRTHSRNNRCHSRRWNGYTKRTGLLTR